MSTSKKWDWLHKQFILSMITKNPRQQVKGYRDFMSEGENDSLLEKMNRKKLPAVLGEQSFVAMIKEKFFEHKRHIEVPDSKRLAPSAEQILSAVCDHYGMEPSQLVFAKRGTLNEARSLAIYLCRHLRGDSLIAIGKAFDINSYSTVSSIIERFKARMRTDRTLTHKVDQLRKAIMRQGQT